MLRALFYAYVIGGLTFVPLCIAFFVFITLYTSVPVGDVDVSKRTRGRMEASSVESEADLPTGDTDTNDTPRTRKGWLTMRRTFEELAGDGSYVTLVRSFLDSRSKDPKRSRPKDMWYVVLKGKVLYLYEDEEMSECEAAVELSGHKVVIYPEGLPDGELFAKRNAICLKPRMPADGMPSVTRQMTLERDGMNEKLEKQDAQRESLLAAEKKKDDAREEAMDPSTPWFIFVRSNVEMEDWYFSLIHASEHPAQTPTLAPLNAIFESADMNHLVATLDEQPDVIPMRWLNAILGRIFFSHYRTHNLEAFIIGRLMKKLSKVKRPAFLTEIAVTEVSVGNKAPMLSKPMLKELTKEGDASIEVHLQYKGEIRITVEATAVINLGARFKSYTVKLVLAAVLRELEGNLLIKVKRPPSNRIWYAFTQTPRMVLEVEPVVSDRQVTWGMILSTIESKFKEIIQESVVMPNMDDIAFFETAPYEHRGGIYSDACRKPHVSTTVPSPTQEDTQSASSVLLPEIVSTSSGETSSPPKPAQDPSLNSMSRAASVPIDVPSTSNASDDSSDSALNNARRRTWFASVRSEDTTPLSAQNIFTDTTESEEPRGRPLEPEKQTTSRSQSTPKPDTNPEFSATEPSRSKTNLSSSRRSLSSQFSTTAELQSDDDESITYAKSSPTTPRKNSDAAQTARPPSPPSFFSTLKSKATDKQAISNTAKEAMRKWGVNWAGFKKDGASQSGDDSSQGGSSPPRSTLLSDSASSIAQKARTSYAEVRAAVAERKERERAQQDDSSDASQSSVSAISGTRVTSNPLPSGSVYLETPHNPSIITSAARLTTPRLSSKKSTPSISRVHTEADLKDLPETSEPVKPIKHAPIHVQPQAKTMSIPGIHASHRGEVQSMGYVAPQQPPAAPDNMLKKPAMQTVYRLWKNPSGQGHDTNGQPDSQPPSEDPRDEEDDTHLAPQSNLLSPVLPKATPPPLPPRSTPALRPASGAIFSSDSPSASETLKNIVEKDDGNRLHSVHDVVPTTSSEVSSVVLEPGSAETVADKSRSQQPQSMVDPAQTLPLSKPPALPPRRIQTPLDSSPAS